MVLLEKFLDSKKCARYLAHYVPVLSFGVARWAIYGLGIGSAPIIAANAVTLALALAILLLKIRFDAGSNGQPSSFRFF
jgi:uncharacterized protein with PQ loop repeat